MKWLGSRVRDSVSNSMVLTATSLVWLVSSASAQEFSRWTRNESVLIRATRVPVGSVIPGILDRSDPIVGDRYVTAYRFSGQAGTMIQVRATGSNDNRTVNSLSLNPYLILYGPNGRIIARTRATSGSIHAFVRLRLPETGDYTAVIASVDRLKPGRYWFLVQAIPKSTTQTLNGIEVSETQRNQAETR